MPAYVRKLESRLIEAHRLCAREASKERTHAEGRAMLKASLITETVLQGTPGEREPNLVAVTLTCLQLDWGLSPGERKDSVSKHLDRGFETQSDLSTARRPHSQSMTQQGKLIVLLAPPHGSGFSVTLRSIGAWRVWRTRQWCLLIIMWFVSTCDNFQIKDMINYEL